MLELEERIWVLDPFLAERARRGSVLGSGGLSGPLQARGLPEILLLLMRTAGLSRVDGDGMFSSPADWLGAIAREAGQFDAACGIRASSVLFVEPEEWANGQVGAALEAMDWPGGSQPFGMLVRLVRDVGRYEVNRAHPELGHVEVGTEISVQGDDCGGPWVFLGLVTGSGDDGAWGCERGAVQPIASARWPIPVGSREERRVFEVLRHLVRGLETNRDLAEAVGGSIEVRVERPLTRFETVGGPCLPDFHLTVRRKKPGGGCPGGSRVDRHDFENTARYCIDIVGADESRSTRSVRERRLRYLGRVFPMKATAFDSRVNDIRRQGQRIGQRIRNDLVRRWSEEGP